MIRLTVVLIVALAPCVVLSDPLPDQPHIYVHGQGSVEFPPESVSVNLRYAATAPEAEEAKVKLEERVASLLSAARDLDIENSDITASAASIRPNTEYLGGDRVTTGVQAARTVHIILRDVGDYAAFAQAAYVSNPASMSMDLAGNSEVYVAEAQRAAVADARNRASMLAESMGMRLSGVYSLSEFDLREKERYGLYPSTRIRSGDEQALYGNLAVPPPSASGDAFLTGLMTATATVYVAYLIEEAP